MFEGKTFWPQGRTMVVLAAATVAQAQSLPTHVNTDPLLKAARQQLAQKHFVEAKRQFSAFAAAHPESVEAQLGKADAELGLHEYDDAEVGYRAIVAKQPQMWLAHKNLVVVEAALGRWEEFDRERAILHDARQRGAEGISARESDVIDSFNVAGQHWIVRAYDEPSGRSLTRYNFERFSPDGRVQAFLSLESASAAAAMVGHPGGPDTPQAGAAAPAIRDFALNWYTGQAHGIVRPYMGAEPSYERVRADAMRWIRQQSATAHQH
ncbi:Tetratricopeptide repeat-containing protein [Bryocella elongata]|uniref:Tetratricopeptide repeat-containing protein n=1 Tax=Bryocella elongata TaxID=863522 RepID=A0A1H5W7G8_9BACT|nr:hypothetical protein [Bryocella elongata]SEF95415.1 Tetratricopeptide repeat-containing protein [Bryocella elongata]